MGAAACRSCVCEDNRIEGGRCCQDRGWARGPRTGRTAGAAAVVFRPDADVAARGPIPVGAGQPDTQAQRVDHRPARRGPHARPYPAAAQPGGLGRGGRDESGPTVRGRRAGHGGVPQAASWAGCCGVGRDRPAEAGRRDVWGEAAVPGVRGAGRERDQHGAPVLRAGADRARVDRRTAVDPGRAPRRPAGLGRDGTAAGAGVSYQGAVGHRYLRRGLRRRSGVRLRLRGRGVRQLHAATGVLRATRAGVRAAGRLHLRGHAGGRHNPDLRAGGHAASQGQPPVGGPLSPGRGRKDSAGTPGHGSPPPRRGTTCWSAVTYAAASWRFTTATCPRGSR